MTNNQSERVRPTFLAGLIVVLLLGMAFLNLPVKVLPFTRFYITIVKIPSTYIYSQPVTVPSSIGRLKLNQQADLISRSSDGEWYKIKYENQFGWVPAAFAEPSIDPVQVPIETFVMQPTPTLIIFMGDLPATSTPLAPTATLPAYLIPNLVLGNVTFITPLPLICFKGVRLAVEINNIGGGAIIPQGRIRIRDIDVENQSPVVSTHATFNSVESQQLLMNGISFRGPSQFGGKIHRIVITVNPDRWIPETNYDDNSREFIYTLQGDC
jgi:hypothetical protein